MYAVVLFAPRTPSTGPICICTITERSHCLYELKQQKINENTHTYTPLTDTASQYSRNKAEISILYNINRSKQQSMQQISETDRPTDYTARIRAFVSALYTFTVISC